MKEREEEGSEEGERMRWSTENNGGLFFSGYLDGGGRRGREWRGGAERRRDGVGATGLCGASGRLWKREEEQKEEKGIEEDGDGGSMDGGGVVSSEAKRRGEKRGVLCDC
ncbi:hypothetical protein HAX54_003254 [Datura stramonium]|uniref:Uncharacterized protein n=1 Tax=Datura stramonium TaxID=4076 RepID=A0ABS8WWK8_DATST|nr:hypothetical protein [Datura stramonium]